MEGGAGLSKKSLCVSVCTAAGTVRTINQDNFYLNGTFLKNPHEVQYTASAECQEGLFAVTDGMGGEKEGEFASLTAAEALSGCQNYKAPYEEMCACVERANAVICERREKTGSRIGTTIVSAVVKGRRLYVYNIGDSRAFLYRDGTLTQLSKDHTVTASLVEAGILTEEEAITDRRSHQLSQHIGIPPEEMCLTLYQSEEQELRFGDILLLCSDGLTDGLDREQIIQLMEKNTDRRGLAEELAAAAMKGGSKDNVTALTVYFQHESWLRRLRSGRAQK